MFESKLKEYVGVRTMVMTVLIRIHMLLKIMFYVACKEKEDV